MSKEKENRVVIKSVRKVDTFESVFLKLPIEVFAKSVLSFFPITSLLPPDDDEYIMKLLLAQSLISNGKIESKSLYNRKFGNASWWRILISSFRNRTIMLRRNHIPVWVRISSTHKRREMISFIERNENYRCVNIPKKGFHTDYCIFDLLPMENPKVPYRWFSRYVYRNKGAFEVFFGRFMLSTYSFDKSIFELCYLLKLKNLVRLEFFKHYEIIKTKNESEEFKGFDYEEGMKNEVKYPKKKNWKLKTLDHLSRSVLECSKYLTELTIQFPIRVSLGVSKSSMMEIMKKKDDDSSSEVPYYETMFFKNQKLQRSLRVLEIKISENVSGIYLLLCDCIWKFGSLEVLDISYNFESLEGSFMVGKLFDNKNLRRNLRKTRLKICHPEFKVNMKTFNTNIFKSFKKLEMIHISHRVGLKLTGKRYLSKLRSLPVFFGGPEKIVASKVGVDEFGLRDRIHEYNKISTERDSMQVELLKKRGIFSNVLITDCKESSRKWIFQADPLLTSLKDTILCSRGLIDENEVKKYSV